MSLLSRLREKQAGKYATATSATIATQAVIEGCTVASDATVTVATPSHRQVQCIMAEVGAGNTVAASRWWLIHYLNRDPLEVACCPEATHAEILERHPDAVAAEPFVQAIRHPSAPMTTSEEVAIREWLARIEETDPATIAEVIGQCQRDAEARGYFTGRAAAERPKPVPFVDDRNLTDRRYRSRCMTSEMQHPKNRCNTSNGSNNF